MRYCQLFKPSVWRYFDNGLYQFLSEYIYKPVAAFCNPRRRSARPGTPNSDTPSGPGVTERCAIGGGKEFAPNASDGVQVGPSETNGLQDGEMFVRQVPLVASRDAHSRYRPFLRGVLPRGLLCAMRAALLILRLQLPSLVTFLYVWLWHGIAPNVGTFSQTNPFFLGLILYFLKFLYFFRFKSKLSCLSWMRAANENSSNPIPSKVTF